MITEDQLEQLAIQWFQDTGWNYVHGAVIAPEGVAAEREDFRAVVLKGRLAEAVGTRRGGLRSTQTMSGPWGSGLARVMGSPWARRIGVSRSLIGIAPVGRKNRREPKA
jgi:hypothetical protein